MNFNWEEFKSNQNIWVHCKTKEESLDFIRNGYKHACVLNMFHGQICSIAKEKGIYYTINYDKLQCKYTLPIIYKEIIEWSDYMKKEKTIWDHIAEHLGVEIDEEFELGNGYKYRINRKNGLQLKHFGDVWVSSDSLNKLLAGKLKIEKQPEFKVGDKFIIPEFTVKHINTNKSSKTIIYENVIAEIENIFKSEERNIYHLKIDDKTIFQTEENYIKSLKRA